jgi:hypothetical protein
LLTESTVLAIVGGVLGVGLAWLGMRAGGDRAARLPRLADAAQRPRHRLHLRPALLTVVFGLVPA